MKKITTLFISAAFLFSCNEETTKTTTVKTVETAPAVTEQQYFGEKISADNAKPVDSLRAMMGSNTELNCKLSGIVDVVCQKKGCWMELKSHDGSCVRVTFKDYSFFMPKDCAGKTAIVDGTAKIEETSVADLKEYAKDDGKTKEEIAAITKPQTELVFEAKGVILQ